MGSLKYFKFEKQQNNRWYIVLPEWEGDKADLEMVCGADTMLDIVAQNEYTVYLTISEEKIEDPLFVLYLNRKENKGGWYNLKGRHHEFEVWLCYVTEYVYGKIPEIFYCR